MACPSYAVELDYVIGQDYELKEDTTALGIDFQFGNFNITSKRAPGQNYYILTLQNEKGDKGFHAVNYGNKEYISVDADLRIKGFQTGIYIYNNYCLTVNGHTEISGISGAAIYTDEEGPRGEMDFKKGLTIYNCNSTYADADHNFFISLYNTDLKAHDFTVNDVGLTAMSSLLSIKSGASVNVTEELKIRGVNASITDEKAPFVSMIEMENASIGANVISIGGEEKTIGGEEKTIGGEEKKGITITQEERGDGQAPAGAGAMGFCGYGDNTIVAEKVTIENLTSNVGIVIGMLLQGNSEIYSKQGSVAEITIKNIKNTSTYQGDPKVSIGLYKDGSLFSKSNSIKIEAIESEQGDALGAIFINDSTSPVIKSRIEIGGVTSGGGIACGLVSNNLLIENGLKIYDIKGEEKSIAVWASDFDSQDSGSLIVISSSKADTENQIQGNLVASPNGTIDAAFNNGKSWLIGSTEQIPATENLSEGIVRAKFSNGAYWKVTDNSTLTELTVGKDAKVDLAYAPEQSAGDANSSRNRAAQPSCKVVTTTSFKAENGGQLSFNVDASNPKNTSQLRVKGEGSGHYTAQLNVSNGGQLEDGTRWVISQESGILTLDNLTYASGAAKAYKLVFIEDLIATPTADENNVEGATTSTNKPGKWYLVSSPDQGGQEGGPQKPPVTPEVDQVLSLGTSVTQALGMLSETEDLRMRMGDVRHGDTDGLWVRTYSRKDSARGSFGNGFEQDVYGVHMGADHVIRTNDNASWLVGGAFHYGQSDIDGAAEAGGGEADIDQYTFKAYATYMKDNGSFADIVLHAGYYDTTLKGKDNTGFGLFKADYSNWGYGVSAEVGHRFDLSSLAKRWYVEPTAQLTWFRAEGKNFKTSTGLAINQGDADFITGRLGAAVGKVFALGTTNDPMSSYFSVAIKGGMLYQFDGDQTVTAHGTDGATVVCADTMDMKGARAYYGMTADWKIDQSWRVYGQISREEGSGYTKDYDASIGVRYAF